MHLLLHPTLPPGHFHETITVPLPAPGKGEDEKMNKGWSWPYGTSRIQESKP